MSPPTELDADLLLAVIGSINAADTGEWLAAGAMIGDLTREYGQVPTMLAFYWVIGRIMGELTAYTDQPTRKVLQRMARDVVTRQ